MQRVLTRGRAGFCILAGLLAAAVCASAFVRPDVPPFAEPIPQPASRESTGVRLVWQRPGEFFPVLGWREPVNLSASGFGFDAELASIPPDRFNCHFYTRYFLRRAQGESIHPTPRHDLVTESCLRSYGLAPARGSICAGDILVAGQPEASGHLRITHSAIVLGVDAHGVPTRIRQKFDGKHPVVDVNYEEFRTLYAGLHPWQIQVWRAHR